MEQTLDSRLSELKDRGAHHYDPVQFCYIESLLQRALEKPISISRILEQKAMDALNEFQERFDKACGEASEIVAHVSLKYPDSADRIREIFENGDFKKVKQLNTKLDRISHQSAISKLVNYIAQKSSHLNNPKDRLSIDDLLLKQEDEIIRSIENPKVDARTAEKQYDTALKSYHLFKISLTKRHSDTLVINAIKERPENPGPLNSQMLAIRALSTMRNLSPDYLNRFISYLDTLLWLERIR